MTGKELILKQALEAVKKSNYNGIVLLPTGTGKGRLMIEVAKILKPTSILYTCDSQDLRDKMIIHEFHKWDAAYLLNITDRYCYQKAHKLVGQHWDLLLADEFDYSLTPEYKKLYANNTFGRKIMVSATLEEEKRKMAKTIAPIIFERKQKELIANKTLNNIQFYIINYDLTERENYEYIEYNNRFKVLLNTPVNAHREDKLDRLKIARKQFLCSLESSRGVVKWLLGTLAARNEKVLIFCGLSKQADAVCENSYHAENGNKQALVDFDMGKIKELAVVDKVNRGQNIDSVRHIIHESVGSSRTRMEQRTGRGLRLDVNETLNVFIPVPHFKHPFYGRKPTIVGDWVQSSTKNMNIENAKIIEYKPVK